MELMELSKLVDDYVEKREERLAADRKANALKKQETHMADRLIQVMRENDTRWCAGHTHRVQMNLSSKPVASDWEALYGYMKEHDAMDLVQKRLHESAIALRVEEGEEIPGIEYNEVTKLSIGKL